MSVKIADKIVQYNNGSYFLMDSSAVEYVDKDGNTKSVKDVLDNTSTDNSTHKTVIFENNIDMGKYLLLAKITDANYSNNIIKFSCPNYKGVNDAGFKYEDDMDIYKFELHFNTGAMRENNSYGVTLKQHGLGLYSYPLSNPKNTEPRLEEAIRLYWDYSKGDIYVFLVDMMTAIPHCVLEYTGSGTLLRKDTFVMDDLYNRRDGINGTWEESKWKSIPYNKLETPPIYELGGDGGSTEGVKTYTSLDELGLTAPVTVGEIFNAMPNNTMAMIACEDTDTHITDIPAHYGVLTIKKNESSRFSIDYQISLNSSPCNVKRWIGTLKGADGTGLYWKQLSAEPTFVTLTDIGLTANATFQDVVDALPKGGSALLGVKDFTNYQTIFPYEEGNDQFARVHIVKGTADGSSVCARWFRKDGGKEAIAIFNLNDNTFSGWQMLKNQQVYTALKELGLTTTAKINDITSAMKDGTTFTYKTDAFDYATEYNNIQLGTVTIIKQSTARVQVLMTDKSTGDLYIGKLSGENKIIGWTKVITENSDPYICTSYKRLTGTEDLFTLPCGHYVSEKANTTYNYPLTDSDKVTAHIYVLGHLNIPADNQGYRIILYFDNKGRTYNANEWWGTFGSWNRLDNDTRVTTLETQVSELFQSVSDGKTLVANAITGKGVSTSTSATFATMATNISKIPQTITWKEETVSASPDSNTHIARFVFSNTVLGVRQMIAPGYHYTAKVTETKMFTINSNTVEVYLDSGTWKMTAMVRNT